tara:strand:- start:4546 stop:4812 length:267 start_codon:yes stop_codon:yes gene_type:complete
MKNLKERPNGRNVKSKEKGTANSHERGRLFEGKRNEVVLGLCKKVALPETQLPFITDDISPWAQGKRSHTIEKIRHQYKGIKKIGVTA